MLTNRWLRKLAFATAGAVAALCSAAACAVPVFSQIVVFGDSSVDSGYYRLLSNPGSNTTYNADWSAAVAAGAGVPTSSPGLMYPQVLASYFGLTANPSNQAGGTNYATSGAKNVDVNTSANGGFKAAIPTVTQIANYLAARGNQADPNALYLISSGGNDISFALGQSGTGPFPSDATAYATSRATGLAIAIASLMSAGAKTFVVANLPAAFPLNNPTEQQLRAGYNQTLFSSLASQSVPVIGADINSVRLAINNNPAAYGFSSTSNTAGGTACTVPPGVTTAWSLLCSSNPSAPSTFSSPNADMTHLFADDQHLATAGQKIIADYIYTLLVNLPGPAQTCTQATVFRYRNTQILGHFYTTSMADGAARIAAGEPLVFEGAAFNACSGGSTSNGIYPVERFKHLLVPGVYFYSLLPQEIASVRANLGNILQDQGIAFYALNFQPSGSFPVYRFRNTAVAGANFYTILDAEKANIIANVPGYAFEGIGFWAMPPSAP
jgi:phospholipase/lecithinase/hemolysin